MASERDAGAAHVLVVDDERSMREFLAILLQREGHRVSAVASVAEALQLLARETPELVFTDLKLADGTGMDVLRWLRGNAPDVQVIMITAFATTENAVEAMRLGAYDYQIKPFKVEEIRVLTQKALEKSRLLRENSRLRALVRGDTGVGRILGTSAAATALRLLIAKVAPTSASVLIEGESGTGKELVARALHEGSLVSAGPFVAINCGAIPESLIEAELFGHGAGAFTGATRARGGLFEAAEGGTLFLDEIAELPLNMQVKLLRVLQERTVRRVGEEHERRVDVRVVAATNKDLLQRVAAGQFREDLYYRLNVVSIKVPPLRERRDDVELLARAFAMKFAQRQGKAIHDIDPDAIAVLRGYDFPGNIRELENCMERAVTLAAGERVQASDLPQGWAASAVPMDPEDVRLPEQGVRLDEVLAELERRYIEAALSRCRTRKEAAEALGLSFRSLRYRMQKLGLGGDDGEDGEQ